MMTKREVLIRYLTLFDKQEVSNEVMKNLSANAQYILKCCRENIIDQRHTILLEDNPDSLQLEQQIKNFSIKTSNLPEPFEGKVNDLDKELRNFRVGIVCNVGTWFWCKFTGDFDFVIHMLEAYKEVVNSKN